LFPFRRGKNLREEEVQEAGFHKGGGKKGENLSKKKPERT